MRNWSTRLGRSPKSLAVPCKMNQVLDNPFPYSDSNKRYHTFSYTMKKRYGKKIAKIPLNAGFTCPNRDGSKSTGGCRFCSSTGSGDTILAPTEDLLIQYDLNWQRAKKKWPDCLGMAYFQSFSNTYAPLEKLKEIYTPFIENPEVTSLSIATRTDCFTEEMARWIAAQPKEIWLEFGLQTIHDSTARAMNLCHTFEDAKTAAALCRQYDIPFCLHLINGLPGEDRIMMVETAKGAASLQPDAIKIHMLHLLDNSVLGKEFLQSPFELLSLEEYVSIVCDQLEVLPADIIIERVTGDGLASDLIAPLWTMKKTITANEIDKELLRRNSWQGRLVKSQ